MNCQAFDRTLDGLLAGKCAPAEWREAEAHLESCPGCRRVFDALGGRGEALSGSDGASLAASVLARTSGIACGAAHQRLSAFVDDALEPFDRELVRGHLDHCAECSALADAIARSTAVLPTFAELPPPDTFVWDVLRATSRRQTRHAGDRLVGWLGRVVARPRFSIEMAYACTLVLVLLVGDPVRAFRDASARGAELARPTVGRAVEDLAGPLSSVRTIRSQTAAVVAAAARRPGGATGWDERLAGAARRLEASARSWAEAAIARVSGWYRVASDAVTRLVRLWWATEPSGPSAR